jgi:hypothetical protein
VFPPALVIERMRESLRAGGNTRFTSRIIPNAGHGLSTIQTAGGKPFRRAISPVFLETLVDWVRAASQAG